MKLMQTLVAIPSLVRIRRNVYWDEIALGHMPLQANQVKHKAAAVPPSIRWAVLTNLVPRYFRDEYQIS